MGKGCRLKKYSQPKSWEFCFIQWGFLGSQDWARDIISSDPERNASRTWEKDSLYRSFAISIRAGSLNIKRLLLKKAIYLKLKNLALFLCLRRCKSLGSLKSFLWYASQLFWGQYPMFFPSWACLGLTIGSGYSQIGGILLPNCP